MALYSVDAAPLAFSTVPNVHWSRDLSDSFLKKAHRNKPANRSEAYLQLLLARSAGADALAMRWPRFGLFEE